MRHQDTTWQALMNFARNTHKDTQNTRWLLDPQLFTDIKEEAKRFINQETDQGEMIVIKNMASGAHK